MALVMRSVMDPMRLAPPLALRRTRTGQGVAGFRHRHPNPQHLALDPSPPVYRGAVGRLRPACPGTGHGRSYGAISYSVTCRTHEIGVRMARGAGRARFLGAVVGGAALLGAAGVAMGVAGGLVLTRLLRSMLYGVSATDPAVFAGVSVFLVIVAALAGYVPARRAAHVDPSRALRQE